MKRTLLLALWLTTVAGVEMGDPRLTATIPWNNGEGYVPVVIQVMSPLERTLHIEIDAGNTSADTSLALAAGEQRRLTVLLPANENQWSNHSLKWRSSDGRSGQTHVNVQHRQRAVGIALVGEEAALPSAPWSELFETVHWDRRTHLSSSAEAVQRIAVDLLPDRWQGYPTWLTVVLHADAQQRLSPAQREALAIWTTAGGLLVVPHAAQAAPWRQIGARVHVSSQPATDTRLSELILSKRDEDQHAGQAPTTENGDRVPATGFMFVALCFALLVGPVNLLWVKRRNARHRFLITTPLLSIATCVILLGADALLHGVALRQDVRQLVALDIPNGRAVTWTFSAYYSGFAVNSLDLDPETEAVRPGDDTNPWNYRRRQGNRTFHVSWGDRQAASGTWTTARTISTVRYRSVAAQRGRVEIRLDGDDLQAVNGLGVALSDVRVFAPDGRRWHFAALDAGAQATTPGDGAPVSNPTDDLAVTEFGHVAQRCVQQLADGWWLLAETATPLSPIPGPVGRTSMPQTYVLVARLATPTGERP